MDFLGTTQQVDVPCISDTPFAYVLVLENFAHRISHVKLLYGEKIRHFLYILNFFCPAVWKCRRYFSQFYLIVLYKHKLNKFVVQQLLNSAIILSGTVCRIISLCFAGCDVQWILCAELCNGCCDCTAWWSVQVLNLEAFLSSPKNKK